MLYRSTRGGPERLGFREVTLRGLAPDGGLYMPETWPRLSPEGIAALRGLSYVDTAVAVMRPFLGGSISDEQLHSLCTLAYDRFAHRAVTPLVQLDARHWLLELFHGPTLAFKDVALQLLGLLFERFLGEDDGHLTVIGATSGDTGSAAIDALAGRAGIDIVMLHPHGRVSDVQRRQMTTVWAPNVHNVAIEGSFDDAQAIVKALFVDRDLAASRRLSAVNSINWARLMAQMVYYFYAAVRLGAPERPVAFSVPTGNFGDVFAGYAAARMGLPVARLIVATNVNDIVARALTSGEHAPGTVVPTATPSMDIQISSNLERLLFDLDPDAVTAQMACRAFHLTDRQREGASALFTPARVDAEAMALAMRRACDESGQIIDPHSAVGLAAAHAVDLPADVPVVTLATAHPAKFRDAVERATGVRPSLPKRVGNLFEREERYDVLPAQVDQVREYIIARTHG